MNVLRILALGGSIYRILRVWKALGGSIYRILRVWRGSGGLQILTAYAYRVGPLKIYLMLLLRARV